MVYIWNHDKVSTKLWKYLEFAILNDKFRYKRRWNITITNFLSILYRFIVTPTIPTFLKSPLNWIDFVATLSFYSDMLLQHFFKVCKLNFKRLTYLTHLVNVFTSKHMILKELLILYFLKSLIFIWIII